MILNKEDKIVRAAIPDRMMSTTFTLPIDDRKVVGIVNYTADVNGVTPLAFWVKIKPTCPLCRNYILSNLKIRARKLNNIFVRYTVS